MLTHPHATKQVGVSCSDMRDTKYRYRARNTLVPGLELGLGFAIFCHLTELLVRHGLPSLSKFKLKAEEQALGLAHSEAKRL